MLKIRVYDRAVMSAREPTVHQYIQSTRIFVLIFVHIPFVLEKYSKQFVKQNWPVYIQKRLRQLFRKKFSFSDEEKKKKENRRKMEKYLK